MPDFSATTVDRSTIPASHDPAPRAGGYNRAPMADTDLGATTLLSASVVTYQTPTDQLERCLSHFITACAALPAARGRIALTLVDNSTDAAEQARVRACAERAQQPVPEQQVRISVHCNPTNLGYGGANNVAIAAATSRYHLVMNPDTYLDADALRCAIGYLDEHPDVAMVVPRGTTPEGSELYLAKGEPTLLVLLLRALGNARLQRLFRRQLARYELRDRYDDNTLPFNAALASGCCMLVRTAALQQISGFDSRYFLYFEDFDLSHRLRGLGKIVVHPGMKIVHEGGGTWRKGMRHRLLFLRSMLTFFSQYGWKLS